MTRKYLDKLMDKAIKLEKMSLDGWRTESKIADLKLRFSKLRDKINKGVKYEK